MMALGAVCHSQIQVLIQQTQGFLPFTDTVGAQLSMGAFISHYNRTQVGCSGQLWLKMLPSK